jgi:hypothetical protein
MSNFTHYNEVISFFDGDDDDTTSLDKEVMHCLKR